MRILQVTSHFHPNTGGVETHLSDLCKGLVQKKNSVFVLTYRPLINKSKALTYEKRHGYSVFRIPWIPGLFYKTIASSFLQFLYLFPGMFVFTPLAIIYFRPEVINAHGIVPLAASFVWSKLFAIPIVASTHSQYHFPSRGLYRRVARYLFNSCQRVLCLSNVSKDELKAIGVKETKLSRFTYWIDTNNFSPARKRGKVLSKNSKELTVLFVGRLVKEKGVVELIGAVDFLMDGIKIVLAGEGPLEEFVNEASLKTPNRIKFIGRVSQEDLPHVYSSSDLLIVPSTHDEGFGRVVLEALSCGTPVVVSNRGGMVESIDLSVGVKINISEKSIANTLNRLNKNREEIKKMASNCRAFALENYSEENLNTILKAYEKSIVD